jgi:hypothetical protein
MDVSRKVLGSYLHIIIQSNRLSKIFIGGGIVDSRRVNPEFRKWYLDGVQEAARDSITQEIRRSEGFPEILAAELGDKTAAFGASKTAYNTWLADKSVLLATEKPSRSA